MKGKDPELDRLNSRDPKNELEITNQFKYI
jgi:hypothetical protein